MLAAAVIFTCAGCITLQEKPQTSSQYDINAIKDAMRGYPQAAKKTAPPKAVKPAVVSKPAAQPVTRQAVVPVPAGKGLALHYSFDRVASGERKVADESGNGRDGTVFGAVLSDDRERGKVYYFNGVDNFILAGKMGYFSSGTISFWMKAETVENWRNPFSTDYANWDSCIRFEESSDGKFCIGALGLGAGFFTASMKPMKWYHVAYAWDDKAAYGYFDGKPVFAVNHPDPGSPVHPNIPDNAGHWKGRSLDFRNVAIGNGYSTAPSRYWKGWVDEVRIYDKALNKNEISKLYKDTKK
jgi:hypothetical protein